ncbi:MAG: hypothetical protein ACR2P0_13585 [Acidimicrobiales bacterium]
MHDSDFDELFDRHGVLAPTPEFEAELLQRLETEIDLLSRPERSRGAAIEGSDGHIGVMTLEEEGHMVNRPRNVLLLVAAAAIVLIGGLWFALSDGSEDGPTITDDVDVTDEVDGAGSEDALGIAEAFMAARDRWDGDAVRELLADNVFIDGAQSSPEDLVGDTAWGRATGRRALDVECLETTIGPPTDIACSYTLENAWSRALHDGPFPGNTMNLTIDGSRITHVANIVDTSDFGRVWNLVSGWIRTTHPDDFPVLYDGRGSGASISPAAVELWEERTLEFVAVRTAIDFMEARDAWDGGAVRDLFAADATIAGFVDAPEEYVSQADFERVTAWRFREPRCTAAVVGPPSEVTCTYEMQNAWSEALGVGPFTGSDFDLVIDDGRITGLTHDFAIEVFSPTVWEVVLDWVRATHPEDVDVLYDFSTSVDRPGTTPQAIELWEQYTAEFISSLEVRE